jgi:hypothetical protein
VYSPGAGHILITNMSESAAKFKLFFLQPLHHPARVGTLKTAGAEDKPLLGSKLSADSGAKTRLGPAPANKPRLIGIEAINPRAGDRVPRRKSTPLSIDSFRASAHSEISFFRRKHVSALNCCMSLFRYSGSQSLFSLAGLVD